MTASSRPPCCHQVRTTQHCTGDDREGGDHPSVRAHPDPMDSQSPLRKDPEGQDDRQRRRCSWGVAPGEERRGQVAEGVHAVAVERGLIDGRAPTGAVAVSRRSSHEDAHETDPQVDLLARAAMASDVLGQKGELVESRASWRAPRGHEPAMRRTDPRSPVTQDPSQSPPVRIILEKYSPRWTIITAHLGEYEISVVGLRVHVLN